MESNIETFLTFRNHLKTKVNRDRFVRCFITKLLTYANGEEPKNFLEIEKKIVQKSASYDHRIVATIAAVIDSPLFREEIDDKYKRLLEIN